MTNEQKRMLRVVAAYNDITEEQAEKAIVEDFLNWLAKDDSLLMNNLDLHIVKEKPETCKTQILPGGSVLTSISVKDMENTADVLLGNKPFPTQIETPEKPRKKPGRKPKTVEQWASDTAREVRQAEKMSKGEFVEYFGGK